MTLIYQIAFDPHWRAAKKLGFYGGGETYDRDGFIHFSTAEELQTSADLYFSGMPDLLLIAVLDHKLGKALKWEKTRDNKLFPHLYGFFNITDAEWVKPLQLGANGKHKIPHLE